VTSVGTITLLDGAMGTELERRGVALADDEKDASERTAGPWSAGALDRAPEVVRAVHMEYAAAGAHVHTACTFRTTPRASNDHWRTRMARAVALAREAAESPHSSRAPSTGRAPARVAGSIAPLED
jgi:S-methylmethionine-dependent homocysteine/selenocysteine methylase